MSTSSIIAGVIDANGPLPPAEMRLACLRAAEDELRASAEEFLRKGEPGAAIAAMSVAYRMHVMAALPPPVERKSEWRRTCSSGSAAHAARSI